jgi:hypothetical protein
MSVYIVDDDKINGIIAWLCLPRSEDLAYIVTYAGYKLPERVERERLAKEMYALNVQAFNLRYDEHYDNDFTYVSAMPTTTITAWKYLGEWLYQCDGQNTNDSPLFVLLHRLHYAMSLHIIYRQIEDGKLK